jgi:hypothetical protein
VTTVVTPALPGDEVPTVPYPHLVMTHGTLAQAIRDGLAASSDAEVVVMDAGGSHSVFDLPQLLATPGDLVIGSRFVDGGTHLGPWWRRLGSKLYGFLCCCATLAPFRDWTSGYRVYRGPAIEIAKSVDVAQGHAWQAAVLAECWREGLDIVEVPITYLPSSSRLSPARIREAARVLWWMLWR